LPLKSADKGTRNTAFPYLQPRNQLSATRKGKVTINNFLRKESDKYHKTTDQTIGRERKRGSPYSLRRPGRRQQKTGFAWTPRREKGRKAEHFSQTISASTSCPQEVFSWEFLYRIKTLGPKKAQQRPLYDFEGNETDAEGAKPTKSLTYLVFQSGRQREGNQLLGRKG